LISKTFQRFFATEASGGLLLMACTLVSLIVANSAWGSAYLGFWHMPVAGLSVELWVNDALMAIFFLLVGLELERELYTGELSDFKNALLPLFAAIGGIAAPALIHYALNAGLPSQPGAGIPMATDIAFALGILALVGSGVPASLKVFLTALAVIDDLGAVSVIAIFYTDHVSMMYLALSLGTLGLLALLNWKFRVMRLAPYVLGGVVAWFFMLKSGVHATVAGVLLAFVIPFSSTAEDESSPSHRLEHALHKPVAFCVLPIFALANTGVQISSNWFEALLNPNALGIMGGLVLGKPIGIVLTCVLVVYLGVCKLPTGVSWRHVIGAGLLAGIGFTMSIFIANLAFAGAPEAINGSKLAILCASCVAGLWGFVWIRVFGTGRSSNSA
jgi:Na+:H+ antiporter, NhaA family